MTEITQKEFEEKVLGATKPVLLGFYRNQDERCQKMASMLEEIQIKLEEKALVYLINVDENITLALNYQVMDLPAYVFMNFGIFQKKLSGAQEPDTLLEELGKLVETGGKQTLKIQG